jgi:hypothetical protein
VATCKIIQKAQKRSNLFPKKYIGRSRQKVLQTTIVHCEQYTKFYSVNFEIIVKKKFIQFEVNRKGRFLKKQNNILHLSYTDKILFLFRFIKNFEFLGDRYSFQSYLTVRILK